MTDNVWNLDEITRNDMRELLATLREYAGYILMDLETFRVIGASVGLDGAAGLAMAELEGSPSPEDFKQALIRGFAAQAGRGEIRAAGYCEVGRGQLPDEAKEVDLLHIHTCCASGVAARISMPYSIHGGQVAFGGSFIHKTAPWLWVDAT